MIHNIFKKSWNRLIKGTFLSIKFRDAPVYKDPSTEELKTIEDELNSMGIQVLPVDISRKKLKKIGEKFELQKYHRLDLDDLKSLFSPPFQSIFNNRVPEKKLLEYYIAYEYCDINSFSKNDIYIDIAGGGSPWAKILREEGINAYSLDLNKKKLFQKYDYYLEEDATNTSFQDNSVTACSLQCSFQMFSGDHDLKFIDECSRILKENGKSVISPLSLHTHFCGYSTPEYYKQGHNDNGAKEYIKKEGRGIPYSRKYSAEQLKKRILDRIKANNMNYKIFKINNKKDFGDSNYCHFFIVITKNQTLNV